MAETNKDLTWEDRLLEQECEAWDWVRAAGVSAQDLRAAVLESLSFAEAA